MEADSKEAPFRDPKLRPHVGQETAAPRETSAPRETAAARETSAPRETQERAMETGLKRPRYVVLKDDPGMWLLVIHRLTQKYASPKNDIATNDLRDCHSEKNYRNIHQDRRTGHRTDQGVGWEGLAVLVQTKFRKGMAHIEDCASLVAQNTCSRASLNPGHKDHADILYCLLDTVDPGRLVWIFYDDDESPIALFYAELASRHGFEVYLVTETPEETWSLYPSPQVISLAEKTCYALHLLRPALFDRAAITADEKNILEELIRRRTIHEVICFCSDVRTILCSDQKSGGEHAATERPAGLNDALVVEDDALVVEDDAFVAEDDAFVGEVDGFVGEVSKLKRALVQAAKLSTTVVTRTGLELPVEFGVKVPCYGRKELVWGLQEKIKEKRFFRVGLTGYGKTTFAKHLAEKCGLPLVTVSPSAIFSKYVGDTEKSINALCRRMIELHSACLFFDDADAWFHDQSIPLEKPLIDFYQLLQEHTLSDPSAVCCIIYAYTRPPPRAPSDPPPPAVKWSPSVAESAAESVAECVIALSHPVGSSTGELSVKAGEQATSSVDISLEPIELIDLPPLDLEAPNGIYEQIVTSAVPPAFRPMLASPLLNCLKQRGIYTANTAELGIAVNQILLRAVVNALNAAPNTSATATCPSIATANDQAGRASDAIHCAYVSMSVPTNNPASGLRQNTDGQNIHSENSSSKHVLSMNEVSNINKVLSEHSCEAATTCQTVPLDTILKQLCYSDICNQILHNLSSRGIIKDLN
ncbi:AAA family ATPase [Gregarina niphandrodes]|uniref:AAA family ATPase n=1 Tax=Gregarina niphandrodes TaxID=110365 RepID=A0A023AZ83_GRENI|nr:AAA family ATPase [Gregarina niphandrodes]EZG43937.1 AAA family ATPase [Gregarina niphandrodes]|eukprot:XP_011132908.1 AAA family ATPase [Gregarina niphandrodes]